MITRPNSLFWKRSKRTGEVLPANWMEKLKSFSTPSPPTPVACLKTLHKVLVSRLDGCFDSPGIRESASTRAAMEIIVAALSLRL